MNLKRILEHDESKGTVIMPHKCTIRKALFKPRILGLFISVHLLLIPALSSPVSASESQIKSRKDLEALFKSISRQKIRVPFTPEYEKSLTTVILSFDSDTPAPQMELIKCLPEYSRIIFFIRKDEDIDKVKDLLSDILSNDCIDNCTFIRTDKRQKIETDTKDSNEFLLLNWMQDIGKGDRKSFFIPITHFSPVIHHFDNLYVEDLRQTGVNVIRLPVFFEGGNILLARNKEGRRYLFLGKKSLEISQELYGQLEVRYIEGYLKSFIKSIFSADEIMLMDEHTRLKSDFILHIDRAFMPLADGLIVVQVLSHLPPQPALSSRQIKREWEEKIKQAKENRAAPEVIESLRKDYQLDLLQLRLYDEAVAYQQKIQSDIKTFTKHGFDVLELETDIIHILRYQSFANCIVYHHKTTGEKSIILPFYPDLTGQYLSEGLNKANKERLESLGYRVTPVREKAYPKGGNSHCLINVLDAPED
jgi:hypothetical protein